MIDRGGQRDNYPDDVPRVGRRLCSIRVLYKVSQHHSDPWKEQRRCDDKSDRVDVDCCCDAEDESSEEQDDRYRDYSWEHLVADHSKNPLYLGERGRGEFLDDLQLPVSPVRVDSTEHPTREEGHANDSRDEEVDVSSVTSHYGYLLYANIQGRIGQLRRIG